MTQENKEANQLPKDVLDQANQLISSLKSGDVASARSLISSLNKFREVSLYQELGKLTRELHESIKDIDSEIDDKLKQPSGCEMSFTTIEYP